MSLLEMTTVIAVLLVLGGVLFMGVNAWRRGCDRAACIGSLRNIQVAVRSYQNMYGYFPGASPVAEYGTQDIALHLYQKNFVADGQYAAMEGIKECPGGGIYTVPMRTVFPKTGDLFVTCSLETEQAHNPTSHAEW